MRSFVVATAVLLFAAAPARAATASVKFTADGSFKVPPGVHSLFIVAIGGHGGSAGNAPGGRGGEATGTLPVFPGTTLTLIFGHGGAAGTGDLFTTGAAGGGMAAVESPGGFVLAAGGGGGAGGNGNTTSAGGDAGASGAGPGAGTTGGAAGTTNGPGSGGNSGGGTGNLFQGGNGGNAGGVGASGGGGGAGEFGGGGGGASDTNGGGGGGGGASGANPTLVQDPTTTLSDAGGPASVTFVYDDSTAPAVTLAAPATNPATFGGTAGVDTGDAGTVTLDLFSGSAAAGTPAFSIDATVGAGGTFSRAVPALPDGTWTVQARQTDNAGNTGTSAPRTFTVDTTKPVVTITAPAANSFVGTNRPHFTGTLGTQPGDVAAVTVTVRPPIGPALVLTATVTGGTWTADATRDIVGQWFATATQGDAAGNQGSSATVEFTIDTDAPAPTVAAPDAYNPATLHGTAENGDVVLAISRDGTLVRTITTAASGGAYSADLNALADGAYSVVAQQTDAAGNQGASAGQSFVVDRTPPEIAVTGLQPAYTFGDAVNAAWNCTDATSGVATCDGPSALDGSVGTHDLAVTATDKAGNTRTVHVPYAVIAAATATPTATPVATPTATPVVVPSKAPAALKITSATAKRVGKTVTLTLRGTAAGTGAIRLTALRHSAAAKLVRGVWTVRLKLKTTAKKLTVSVSDAGDATHRTGSARRTVTVR